MTGTFEFKQCTGVLKSTGRKAKDLHELREAISSVSANSVYHHTFQYFQKGHLLEYTNDFAHWAGESIEERVLSEILSNIDPYTFKDVDRLRARLLEVIDDYLVNFPAPRQAMDGAEFYFNETVTIIFPAGVSAKNLAEFLMAVKYVDAASIYYHFFEARVRLGGTDDFSKWLEEALDKKRLAEKVQAIDPFMYDVEGIRRRLAEAVEDEVRSDMEGSRA